MNQAGKLFDAVKSTVFFCMPVFYAAFPKCPFCLAAYLSLFGITGLELRPFFPHLLWLMPAMIAVNFYSLYRMGVKTRNFFPLFICTSGLLSIISARYFFPGTNMTSLGLILISCGVLLNHFQGRLPFIGRWLSKRRTEVNNFSA